MAMSKTRLIALVGVMTGLAVILQLLEFITVIFPDYLKMDFSDIPAIFTAFTAGPIAGVLVELLKNLIHGMFTGFKFYGAGEAANFFAGIGYLVPVALIMRNNRKNSPVAYAAGAVCMTVLANIFNYFVALRLYGMPKPAFWPTIWGFLIWFNLFKAAVISVVTALLYTKMKVLLNRFLSEYAEAR